MADITLPDGTTQEVDYGKSTLFRFSTTHRPEVTTSKKETLFPRTGYEHGTSASLLQNLNDLLVFNDKLFHFSEWVTGNEFDLEFAEIGNRLDGVITLSGENEDKVWDGLHQQYDSQQEGGIAKESVNLVRGNAFTIAFNELTASDPELIIEETDFQNIRIELDNFPKDPLITVNVSRPESPAAFTGYPLGKLLAVQGANAVISNNTIETYSLESPFTVNQNLFASDAELDFETPEGLENILSHIITPAENGKVKPLGLSTDAFNDDFINIQRDQFVGIAIASTDTTVTVAKMPYLSLIFHAGRRAASKGLLFND